VETKSKIIELMKPKKIVGIAIFSISIGALVYIYKGYYLPKKQVESMSAKELKNQATTTTPKV
jgi:hypothetical protein